ncbi:MAG TPA: biotin carboxylase N-terminal domain-containing protein [Thermoanaerobaculaceae bacterium]|nr:biotin carboxylase N-terminal domain-containing protein [Thermoanaerobaculaceae bacterium]
MRILIANRGEIAVRLLRACRELGHEGVAVYSDVDRTQPHVLSADLAVRIGPAPARDSYLNQGAIIEAARSTGAGAVHPGYGFLAENPGFARLVEASGLVWIGPPPDVIELLGSKTAAREVARKVGVPVVPGSEPLRDAGAARAFADTIGYPILLKAVGGGGGKGMRIVRREAEVEEAFARAASEGKAFFADERVYAEKLVKRPRHVEVQILGDRHGTVVHLGERECSLQRRHQKVFEECPSVAVDAGLRQRLGDSALAVARAVSYRSAGTVEFLLAPSGEFFFLEVNTRLQVEHPVTEAVYGVDLAQLMIREALGEALPVRQDSLLPRGHALECRVYAEDPLRGFAPSPGTISSLERPHGPGVRVDSGVREGSVVPLDYDPILAKLVVWAEDRPRALARLRRALGEYHIAGIATTLPLFRLLLDVPEFQTGALHTGLLDELLARGPVQALEAAGDPAVEEAAIVAAACLAAEEAEHLPHDAFEISEREGRGWRVAGRTLAQGREPR